MRRVLLFISTIFLISIAACSDQGDKLKAKRDAEIKELILKIQSNDLASSEKVIWRIAEINAVELIPDLIVSSRGTHSMTANKYFN